MHTSELATSPLLSLLQALESTVVSDNLLVNASLALLYGVFTLMTVVAPRIVSVIGPRWSIVLGAVPYVLLVFANMAPSYYTFLPAFAAVGFGAAILWTGQGIHLSRCAIKEAALKGESSEAATSRFNGMFWTAFQFNAAVGLIASSVIFQTVSNYKTAVNYLFLGLGILGSCGVGILLTMTPVSSSAEDDQMSEASQPLTPAGEVEAGSSDKRSDDDGGSKASAPPISIIETLRLVAKSVPMQLLVPIIFYNGASLGFHFANFPLLYQGGCGLRDKA